MEQYLLLAEHVSEDGWQLQVQQPEDSQEARARLESEQLAQLLRLAAQL